MKKIGTEEHFCLPPWQKIIPLTFNREAADRINRLLGDVEEYRLKDMDENEVALQDVGAAVKELERSVKVLGFKGVEDRRKICYKNAEKLFKLN